MDSVNKGVIDLYANRHQKLPPLTEILAHRKNRDGRALMVEGMRDRGETDPWEIRDEEHVMFHSGITNRVFLRAADLLFGMMAVLGEFIEMKGRAKSEGSILLKDGVSGVNPLKLVDIPIHDPMAKFRNGIYRL
ncbi:MAG: hypothetical protein WCP41_03025 [Verrucomicrobiota bacterium]